MEVQPSWVWMLVLGVIALLVTALLLS
jgi:hypothetical protein